MANKKMVARVDTVYTKEDGSTGFAYGFEEFQASAENAKDLKAQNRADYADEKDAEAARKAEVREGDKRVSQAHIDDLNASRKATDTGLKGTDAAGSNAMPATGSDFENEGEATGESTQVRVRTARGGDRSVTNTDERGPFTEAEAAASASSAQAGGTQSSGE